MDNFLEILQELHYFFYFFIENYFVRKIVFSKKKQL